LHLTLGHSPDSDDAFMFYGLARGLVGTRGYTFEHVLKDIETLNAWAREGRLDVTAVSVHGYAGIADRYAILTHGASMGDGYGPLVVAPRSMSPEELRREVIAIPGTRTSAYLALRLYLGDFRYEVCPFDEIMERVADGHCAAGLLIHEGQLSYPEAGLQALVDLGRWWKDDTGLPLPLGVNVVRKALGPEVMREASAVLRESIRYGLEHRREALEYALQFGRGIDDVMADRFVGMYVNDWTLDMGAAGQESIRRFLTRGHEAGVITEMPRIEFVA
jgi:1,4-dihydroxy-6-naphthoate synthase